MNAWALVEISNTASWAMDGFQIGTDRGNARHWKGWIGPVFAYSSVRTADERRAIKLWYDLRYELFTLDGTALEFPDPTITGIHWSRHNRMPTAWDEVTIRHVYEDESASVSDTTDTPPARWEIAFTGLSAAEAEIFDAFNESARRKRTFSFRDKYGETHTGVRIESYTRSHDEHKGWMSEARFTLVKY